MTENDLLPTIESQSTYDSSDGIFIVDGFTLSSLDRKVELEISSDGIDKYLPDN